MAKKSSKQSSKQSTQNTNDLSAVEAPARKMSESKARRTLRLASLDSAEIDSRISAMIADGTVASAREQYDPFGPAAVNARKIQAAIALFNSTDGAAHGCLLSLRVTFEKNGKAVSRKVDSFLDKKD
jgi:tryptophanyl-tRNA synthetase